MQRSDVWKVLKTELQNSPSAERELNESFIIRYEATEVVLEASLKWH
jgi:hypothetical protein